MSDEFDVDRIVFKHFQDIEKAGRGSAHLGCIRIEIFI